MCGPRPDEGCPLRRRQFFTPLGDAVAWPLAVRAQHSAMPVMRPFSEGPERRRLCRGPGCPVIGYLSGGWPGPFAPFAAAFHEGLKDAGCVEGPQCRNRIPLGREGIPYGACRLTFRSVILR